MGGKDGGVGRQLRLCTVAHDLPPGFVVLRGEARAEGHTHMDRLAADWTSGANRFDRPGEVLLAAFAGGALTGIGGISLEPSDPAALRMRRFYVRPEFRRQGIARRLAETLIAGARPHTRCIVLNAPDSAAPFWEALGFIPDRRDGHTHSQTW